MAGGVIGYATLPIIPSFQGIGSAIAGGVTGPLNTAGKDAGVSAGNNFKTGLLNVAKTIAAPLIAYAGFSAIKEGIGTSIENASDLVEAGTAVGAVFGDAFPQIEAFAKSASVTIGQSTVSALNAAKTFGVYGQSAGLAGQANVTFSTGLAGLATDLASFHNTSPEQAIEAIGAALRGETEPIRAYGVLLDDATLRQKALELGLIENTKNALTPQQRVLAVQAALYQQTGVAQGDFQKTSAGLANQQRILSANATDLSGKLGGLLLPAVTGLFSWLNTNAIPVAQNLAGVLSGEVAFSMDALPRPLQLATQAVFSLVNSFRAADGDITSSGLNGYLERLGYIGSILWAALLPLIPAAMDVGGAIFAASQQLGISVFQLLPDVLMLIASALTTVTPLVTGLSGFLVDNQAIVVTLVAAYAGYRVISTVIGIATAAQGAYTAASYGAQGASYGAATATKVQAVAARVGAGAQALMSASVWTSVAAWNASNVSVMRNSSLTLGTKAAILASSVVTGIATVAQWAWNAAMSANPIGIVIILIAALVAAIIWVATQTTFFQDAWTNVTNAIGVAVNWLWVSVIQPVFAFIGGVFTWLFDNVIYPVVFGIMLWIGLWAALITWLWDAVVSPVLGLIGAAFQLLWAAFVQPVIDAWAAAFNWLWTSVISPIGSFFVTVFGLIGTGVSIMWQSYISPALAAVGGAFNWLWTSVISPIGNWIGGALRTIGGVVQTVFGGIGAFIGSAFQSALSLVKGPINGIIGLVNDVIGGLNKISVKIPSWVPIVGGQTFSLSIPTIPKLAMGADITARAGGTLALLGEAGQDETVTNKGMTNALIADALEVSQRALRADRAPRQLIVEGNVYGDPEDIVREWDERDRQSAALEDLSAIEEVTVA